MRLDRSLRFAAGALAFAVIVASTATVRAQAVDPAVREQLTPTGKLRVGVAAGLTPGTGNVAIDPANGRPRGIGAELGAALGHKLGVEAEWVTYLNSGDLTDAGTTDAWDVAFMPVDEQRKQKLDFGAAHIVLQSTWMVGPGSLIQTLADVDKPGTRVVGVENTASSRAAQRFLKSVMVGLVKSTDEGFELLRASKVDVTGGSPGGLVQVAAGISRPRWRLSQFVRRRCGTEGSACRLGLCDRLRRRSEGLGFGAPHSRQFRHAELGDPTCRDETLRSRARRCPVRL
jgi:polar amino acid transport system substrate-binding protein